MADYVLSVKVTGDEKEFVKALENAGATFEKLENTVKNTGLDSFSDKLKGVGSSMKQVGSKMSNTFTKPVLAAGTALGGVTLAKGWARMTEIDSAKVKLEAIGLTATQVQKVTDNALASVKGTAYSMADAMTTAASATAAGIKPGKDLQKYLTQVADAAAVAGTDMSEMGSIFNKVATQGKANNEVLQQLAEKGIPIYQWLADEIGVTAEEVFNLASRGKIDLATFRKAVESNIGGAAKEMGSKTITGAIDNMWAAVARLGEGFLGSADNGKSFAGRLIPLINKMTDGIDNLTEKAKKYGATFGEVFGAVFSYMSTGEVAWQGMNDNAREAFRSIQPLLSALRDVDWVEVLKSSGETIRTVYAPLIEIFAKLVEVFLRLPEGVQGKLLGIAVAGGPLLKLFGGITSLGGSVVGTLGGLVGKFNALGKPMETTATAAGSVNPKISALGANALKAGAGVALLGVGILAAGVGMTFFANAAVTLANAGGGAIAVCFGMIAAFGGLMALLSLLGPAALLAGAGVALLGAGLMMAGAGAYLLGKGIEAASNALPKIGKHGAKAAEGIVAIGAAASQLKLGSLIKLGGLAVEFASLSRSTTKMANGLKTIPPATNTGISALNKFKTSASNAFSQANSKLNAFLKNVQKIKNITGKVTIKAKVPHFSVSWTTASKGGATAYIPNIKQWAKGAVFSGPSLLAGGNLVGEAGPEAVAPISTLQKYVTEAVTDTSNSDMLTSAIRELAGAISTGIMASNAGNVGGNCHITVELGGAKVAEQIFRMSERGRKALVG